MLQLKQLAQRVLDEGKPVKRRNGTVIRKFADQIRFDLADGFPACTAKKLAFRSMIGELLWFMNGETRLSELKYRSVLKESDWSIWTDDLAKYLKRLEGVDVPEMYQSHPDDLGYIYGALWRRMAVADSTQDDGITIIDQLANVIEKIKEVKENPESPYASRLRVTAWDPEYVTEEAGLLGALPTCHVGYQFTVDGDRLHLVWEQRSVN